MSTKEGSYKSLLQGVSQQVPSERLPGQVGAQENMLSDAVTNVRRRPGAEYAVSMAFPSGTSTSVKAWFTDIAGQRVHVYLNCATGAIKILDEDFTVVATLAGGAYLTTATIADIQATTVGDEFFLVNRSVMPTAVVAGGGTDPSLSGFAYVAAGAFGRQYTLTITGSDQVSYITPSGSGADDAKYTSPDYIAQNLRNQLYNQDATSILIKSLETAGVLEKNTTPLAAPTWVDVTVGQEILLSEVANGQLRLNSASALTSWVFTYTLKFGATEHTTVASVSKDLRANDAVLLTKQEFLGLISDHANTSDITITVTGPYMFFTRSTATVVNSSSGSAYFVVSKDGYVAAQGNLPATLPSVADGYICRVGSTTLPQYYKYDSARTVWIECGEYGAPTSLTGMPVSITYNGTIWGFTSETFEGRLSGNEESNPTPWFITTGITGMSAYQGRLILLSGSRVNMSASNKPRRFFRSTVTSILDSDPIEVGSSANSSADYEYAVPFQKDLVLFSEAYQALVPSGNTAISPRTASVVLTSSHESDMTSPPVVLGRTLMYASPKSKDFFGVMEMVPSQYTDSQYISQDATPHLPKYMGGRCRFSVSSSVANTTLFAPSGDLNSLIVHEYLWDGDQKVQQAWHRWTFEYEIAAAYFASEIVVLLFVRNGTLVVCTIDPRVGVLTSSATRRPFLDFYSSATAVGRQYDVPTWLTDFDPLAADKVKLSVVSGSLAGDAVGFTKVDANELEVVISFADADIALGYTYRSSLSPSPPLVRDYNEVVVHSNKQTLLRYLIGTKNSAKFYATVQDKNPSDAAADSVVGTLTWSSAELDLGQAKYSSESHVVVPCRTDAPSTVAEFYTEGTGELNVVSLEYVMKTHQKIRRG